MHTDRIAALKREAFKRQGHGEYRQVSEGDFLGEVTRSEKVTCHFLPQRILPVQDYGQALKTLAPRHVDTKLNKVDAEDLGTKDDFTTNKLENVLVKKGMLSKKKKEEDDENAEYQESIRRWSVIGLQRIWILIHSGD